MKAFLETQSEKHTSPHSFLGPVGRRHSGIERLVLNLLSEWLSTGGHCTVLTRSTVSLRSQASATIAAFLFPSPFLSRELSKLAFLGCGDDPFIISKNFHRKSP